MPTTEQLRGLKDVLVSAFSGGVRMLGETHAAIARYPFRALETIPVTRLPATAVRVLHDGIAGSVYWTISGAAHGAGVAADAALAPLGEGALGESPAPLPLDLAVAALNGFVGDQL